MEKTKIIKSKWNHQPIIAIIVWDIGQIGGIATQAVEIKSLLDRNGINNDIIILNDKVKSFRFLKQFDFKDIFGLGGIELSIRKEHILKTLKYLENYDILLHTTACIHNPNLPWWAVYELRKKQIVIISDVYWNKYYPYFDRVISYVTKFLATNQAVKNYLKKEKNIETEVFLHPFKVSQSEIDLTKKQNIVIWANQWRGWKGINIFLKQVEKIKGKVWLFGGGREYSNWKQKLLEMENVQYFGFIKTESLYKIYEIAKIAIDLTGNSPKYWGHFNRTTIEPMFFKCAVACNETLVEPNSFIPQNVVLKVNKNNFIDKINELLKNKANFEQLVQRAEIWIKTTYRDEIILNQII